MKNSDVHKTSWTLIVAAAEVSTNEWDRAHALKRGGHQLPISIDIVEQELAIRRVTQQVPGLHRRAV
jgi:hypothetical protein